MHKGIEPVSLSGEKMGRRGWCDGGARLLIRDGRERRGERLCWLIRGKDDGGDVRWGSAFANQG